MRRSGWDAGCRAGGQCRLPPALARLAWLSISNASLCTGTVSGRKKNFAFCCNLKEGAKSTHFSFLPDSGPFEKINQMFSAKAHSGPHSIKLHQLKGRRESRRKGHCGAGDGGMIHGGVGEGLHCLSSQLRGGGVGTGTRHDVGLLLLVEGLCLCSEKRQNPSEVPLGSQPTHSSES